MEDKKNVDAYLSKYQIREVLNVAVNKVLRELPLQPLSHLAEALTADSCQAYGILSVTAREVLDASGFPTVLCDVRTPRGPFYTFPYSSFYVSPA